ncbi:secondary thiamine-phosphate synthase enzyme YjbQ [Plebeiibacterium marinum]|uniref:Secondary thiamine-phosphate synthase enzyme YjbQ n=1 Tax=Plebeiibacterium marinum TaxID=2992111 RepID=A0AAE3MHF7_9BACT|nr:secondary thiamine-phosphate synthase enzyme YjbQ [Plebeiobacterium marinum]MCW3807814.1 secondary thiamine-phosphate synthase enzyme YjbQ [Plebeiobacterium marinum]
MIKQKTIKLPEFRRGFHLITNIIESQLDLPDTGLLNLFIQHTSAALTINENADPSVRVDFETILNNMVPENQPEYTHTLEGDDDMPAHMKSSLMNPSLTIPITNGRLNLGTWQGIYFCEFRNFGGHRNVVATIYS